MMSMNATEDETEVKAWKCANLDIAKITSVPAHPWALRDSCSLG